LNIPRRHSPEEYTIIELDVPDLDESYKGLKKERDELEKDLKDKYKLVVTFKKQYEELKNARPSHSKRVRRVVEEILTITITQRFMLYNYV